MVLNLTLAALLAGITGYTDAKEMKVYNRHTFPAMGLGLVLAIAQGRYDLMLSAVIVFTFYYFIYAFPKVISRLAVSMGGMPLPEGKSAIAGGDLKLATALALFLGHIPVLYGTALASFLMLLYHGIKMWIATGKATALIFVATGKGGHIAAAYAPFLGSCSVLVAILLNWPGFLYSTLLLR